MEPAVQQTVERFILTPSGEGITVKLKHAGNALRFALVCAAALAVVWVLGPFGPAPQPAFTMDLVVATSVILGLTLVFALVGAVYTRECTITRSHFAFRDTFGRSGKIDFKGKLPVRIAITTGKHRGPYPFAIHLLLSDGSLSGVRFEVSRKESANAILEALRKVVKVDVVDVLRISGTRVERVGMDVLA